MFRLSFLFFKKKFIQSFIFSPSFYFSIPVLSEGEGEYFPLPLFWPHGIIIIHVLGFWELKTRDIEMNEKREKRETGLL